MKSFLAFIYGAWEFELRTSCLFSKYSYPLSRLLIPTLVSLKAKMWSKVIHFTVPLCTDLDSWVVLIKGKLACWFSSCVLKKLCFYF